MASKLKERRVSRRPPCAHRSAGPPSRPGPEPFAAFPFEKHPPQKTTTPPSQKQVCPAGAVRAVGEPPGPRGEDRPPEHHPSRGRVAPGTAARSGAGDWLPRTGPGAAVTARLDPSVFFSPANAPHMFCRGRRFPIK